MGAVNAVNGDTVVLSDGVGCEKSRYLVGAFQSTSYCVVCVSVQYSTSSTHQREICTVHPSLKSYQPTYLSKSPSSPYPHPPHPSICTLPIPTLSLGSPTSRHHMHARDLAPPLHPPALREHTRHTPIPCTAELRRLVSTTEPSSQL